ncbi:sphingomyelin synthase family protein [Myxococcota bacterium]|nr:sphingomyelin synthase family protein [Myxococcota bacterium]
MKIPNHIGAALAWRYLTHSLMSGLCVLNEGRAAPRLPDLILDNIPRNEWALSWNYHLWILCYFPLALWLWRKNRAAFVHFLYVGGIISLARGLTIITTGLGPTDGLDTNAGMSLHALARAWWQLVNPLTTLTGGGAHIHLTKDLFFSGHTATTFLLWLYAREEGLGGLALIAHLIVVAIVFLSHLHYTIDVIGAWAITFSLYTLIRRRWPPERLCLNLSR